MLLCSSHESVQSKLKVQYSTVTVVNFIRVFTVFWKRNLWIAWWQIISELQRLSEGVNIMAIWDLFVLRTVWALIEGITYSSRVTECSIRVTDCSIKVYINLVCQVWSYTRTLKLSLSMCIAYLAGGVAIHLANSIVCKFSGILALQSI